MLSRVHYTFWKPSDLRDIAIAYDGVGLTHVFFVDQRNQVEIEHPKWIEVPESDLDKHAILRSAVSQLEEYFEGKRAKFQLPLNPKGTPFQKMVWKAVQDVHYGSTAPYKAIAGAVGKQKAAREIGAVNASNPILIVCPCHRIIGADGSLRGYSGGLETKQYLLDFEKKHKHFV